MYFGIKYWYVIFFLKWIGIESCLKFVYIIFFGEVCEDIFLEILIVKI